MYAREILPSVTTATRETKPEPEDGWSRIDETTCGSQQTAYVKLELEDDDLAKSDEEDVKETPLLPIK